LALVVLQKERMPNSEAKQMVAAARESLARPFEFDDFLARLAPKDKVSAGRRVEILEAESDAEGVRLWKRLACTLMKLSGHAAKLLGKQTVQFYVADGKHRMQVFALEDLQDGNFTIFCPDILPEALAAGLLAHVEPPDAGMYAVAACAEPMHIEALDGSSPNLGQHVKDMTGWNRKAIRLTLGRSPSPAHLETAELLCAIAAHHFAAAH